MRRTDLKNAFGPIPEDCYRALMSAAHSVQEEKIVKRKVSVALAMTLALVLIVGAAFALVTWRDTARQIVETEQTDGYFEDWPVATKADLVRALVEQGYVEKSAEIGRLLDGALADAEAGRVADAALAAFTGQEVSEISFMGIMEAAWGPFERWTKEEQAWYSQLMTDMGIQKEDHTLYVEPEGAVDEARAIAIARREIAKGYGVTESALDGYPITTSFQVPEFAEPGDKQPYWQVEFWAPEGMPQEERLFPTSFWVFIHPETGALPEPVEVLMGPLQEYKARAFELDLQNQAALSFDASIASIEGMAAFRETWEPRLPELAAAGQSEPGVVYRPRFLQSMARLIPEIGLPGGTDISRDEALEKARETVMAELGWPRETMDLFVTSGEVYLTPQDLGRPVYQFLFAGKRITAQEWNAQAQKAHEAYWETLYAAFGGPEHTPRYVSVRIDAQTGTAAEAPRVLYNLEGTDDWDLMVPR